MRAHATGLGASRRRCSNYIECTSPQAPMQSDEGSRVVLPTPPGLMLHQGGGEWVGHRLVDVCQVETVTARLFELLGIFNTQAELKTSLTLFSFHFACRFGGEHWRVLLPSVGTIGRVPGGWYQVPLADNSVPPPPPYPPPGWLPHQPPPPPVAYCVAVAILPGEGGVALLMKIYARYAVGVCRFRVADRSVLQSAKNWAGAVGFDWHLACQGDWNECTFADVWAALPEVDRRKTRCNASGSHWMAAETGEQFGAFAMAGNKSEYERSMALAGVVARMIFFGDAGPQHDLPKGIAEFFIEQMSRR